MVTDRPTLLITLAVVVALEEPLVELETLPLLAFVTAPEPDEVDTAAPLVLSRPAVMVTATNVTSLPLIVPLVVIVVLADLVIQSVSVAVAIIAVS